MLEKYKRTLFPGVDVFGFVHFLKLQLAANCGYRAFWQDNLN